jgi:hypothetical protein
MRMSILSMQIPTRKINKILSAEMDVLRRSTKNQGKKE